jgi:uncharacterized DUF497 family protein
VTPPNERDGKEDDNRVRESHPLGTTLADPDHSLAEDRYITVGMSSRRRLVIAAHTERGERIRIISARELTRAEREAYEEETQK